MIHIIISNCRIMDLPDLAVRERLAKDLVLKCWMT